MTGNEPQDNGRVSRRRFLKGASSVGLAAGIGGLAVERGRASGPDTTKSFDTVPFWGVHQAGIATPAQDKIQFASFDLRTNSRREVANLLQVWSSAASKLCAAEPIAAPEADALAPDDSGETLDHSATRLTITFGLGPGLFGSESSDRYGLANQRPEALSDLPAFATDILDPARCGGDLAIQCCADDSMVAFHAVRSLARIARGVAVLRWSQIGFGQTSRNAAAATTPRNLLGFKDGTNNIRVGDVQSMNRWVWAGDEGPNWMIGGSYLVVRRIRINIEQWDRDSLQDQQARIGRVKESGAPLGGTLEFDAVDLDARSSRQLLVPADAHIRLASHMTNNGVKILRRSYSFADGAEELGRMDAGQLFICYQRDPRQQFVPIQQRLADHDALNHYISHTTSAIFACPPGALYGDWVGRTLFEA
jgi:deferrochelatase/peroxidase EfeB